MSLMEFRAGGGDIKWSHDHYGTNYFAGALALKTGMKGNLIIMVISAFSPKKTFLFNTFSG